MTLETTISIALTTLIVAGVLAVQIVNALARRRHREHVECPYLVDELGLEVWQNRFLVDTKIARFRGELDGQATQVEVGAGGQEVYIRVDYDFEKPVDLGLRVSSEHEDGFLTRFMRLHEVELGHPAFDAQFILLARDEERLEDLMNEPIRRALVGLGKRVKDLRLNDTGLHLQLFGEPDKAEVLDIIRQAARLTDDFFRRAMRAQDERLQSTHEQFTPMTGTMTAVPAEEARP